MNKAQKAKRNWLIVLILTAVLGVAGIPGTVITASAGIYPLMAVCIALIVHAFYGTVFYAFAFIAASNTVKVLKVWESAGITDIDEMSAAVMLRKNDTRAAMKRCIERGYIAGYTLTEKGFEPINDHRDKNAERFCRYCGRKLSDGQEVCPSCGAPAKNKNQP